MINKILNLTEKSFKKYTGPNRDFKEKNIIFGYNGRGKSSLAKGLINQFIKEKNTQDNFRFFNRDYIVNNLLLKESFDSKIKGVIANFGQKDVDIAKEIDSLELNIIDTKKLEFEIKDINNKIRLEIDKVHNEKKGNAQIQKKPTTKSNIEVLELYKEDLEKAIKIESDEKELLKITGDNTLEKKLLSIQQVNIPEISFFDLKEIDNVNEVFNKDFNDIDIPNSKIIEWINIGLQIHSDGEVCKFCGGIPNLQYIKQNLEKYNSNEKQKSSIILINFKKIIESILSQIEILLNSKDNLKIILEEDISNSIVQIENSNVVLNKINNILSNKIENINMRMDFNGDELKNTLLTLKKAYEKIVSLKNNKLKVLNEKISKLNILVKGSIALEIQKNAFISSNMELVLQKQNLLNRTNNKNKQILSKIEELKKSKSNTKDFADHISSILSMLEINLKLEVLNDDYIIKHSITNEVLKLNDISEGEQNLLSLLYFYYELFEDKDQKQLKKSINLIVIDDPIASVDDINRMYILELVKKICELDDIQLFIFTHVWDDYCNICYNKSDKINTPFAFFEIKKDMNGSKIVDAKTNETPYKHNFKEIYEFSQKSNYDDISDCEIYHYPNIMRKILEEFLSFKVKNSSPTYTNIRNIKLVLCDNAPTNKDEIAIGMLLNVCNILSHKSSRNPDEILKSAKFLMKKIEKVDKLHFDTMKA